MCVGRDRFFGENAYLAEPLLQPWNCLRQVLAAVAGSRSSTRLPSTLGIHLTSSRVLDTPPVFCWAVGGMCLVYPCDAGCYVPVLELRMADVKMGVVVKHTEWRATPITWLAPVHRSETEREAI